MKVQVGEQRKTACKAERFSSNPTHYTKSFNLQYQHFQQPKSQTHTIFITGHKTDSWRALYAFLVMWHCKQKLKKMKDFRQTNHRIATASFSARIGNHSQYLLASLSKHPFDHKVTSVFPVQTFISQSTVLQNGSFHKFESRRNAVRLNLKRTYTCMLKLKWFFFMCPK